MSDDALDNVCGSLVDREELTADAQATDPTAGLVHPDKLFPPIPEEELADGRTREGKEQRAYLKRREEYVKLYNLVQRLKDEAGMHRRDLKSLHGYVTRENERHTRSYNELLAANRTLEDMVYHTAWIEAVCFALALITQRRPQHFSIPNLRATARQARREFTLGYIKVVLMPGQRQFTLYTRAAGKETFITDAQGNLTPSESRKLFGYLVDAGVNPDPSKIRHIVTDSYRSETYPATATRSSMMGAFLGGIAAGAVFGTPPNPMRTRPNYPG